MRHLVFCLSLSLSLVSSSSSSCDASSSPCADGLVCAPAANATAGDSAQYACRECRADWECAIAEQVCMRSVQGAQTCAHKHLIPFDTTDLLAFLLVFIACAIAAGGGIGGGGLLVPLLILLLKFGAHEATPLSNVAIFGGSIANLAFNARRRHPANEKKPLIQYEVAMLMEPTTILGALVGAMLNKMFPPWLITVLLMLVLGITGVRTLRKGIAGWRRESTPSSLGESLLRSPSAATVGRMRPRVASSSRSPERGVDPIGSLSSWPDEELPSAEADDPYVAIHATLSAAAAAPAATSQWTAPPTDVTVEAYPLRDALILFLVLLGSFSFSLLRGNGVSSPLSVRCGSAEFYSLLLLQLGFVSLCVLAIRAMLLRRESSRAARGCEYRQDDVRWAPSAAPQKSPGVFFFLACASAGVCAGLFGIGGGIIKGPLLLELGLSPAVSSATAAYMILFTTAAASSQYAIIGALRPHYSLALFLNGFLGTVFGQLGIRMLLRRWRKHSLIVLIIGGIIAASALMMGIVGALNMVESVTAGKDQGFRPLCPASS